MIISNGCLFDFKIFLHLLGMWIIFETENLKRKYMIEVRGHETLNACLERAQEMFPIEIRDFQLEIQNDNHTDECDPTKTIKELGLQDNVLIRIRSPKEDSRSRKTHSAPPSRSISRDMGIQRSFSVDEQ